MVVFVSVIFDLCSWLMKLLNKITIFGRLTRSTSQKEWKFESGCIDLEWIWVNLFVSLMCLWGFFTNLDILHNFYFDRYLSELLAERHKLTPFLPVLPHAFRLLNQGEHYCLCCFIICIFISHHTSFFASDSWSYYTVDRTYY